MITDEAFAHHLGLQFSVSDVVRDEIEPSLDRFGYGLGARLRQILGKVYDCPKDARRDVIFVEETAESLDRVADKPISDGLLEDLNEIHDDLEWVASDQGRMRRAALEPILDFKRRFEAWTIGDPRFEGVLVGGHAQKPIIFISGVLNRAEDREALDAIVGAIEAGLPVEIEIVRVGPKKTEIDASTKGNGNG